MKQGALKCNTTCVWSLAEGMEEGGERIGRTWSRGVGLVVSVDDLNE